MFSTLLAFSSTTTADVIVSHSHTWDLGSHGWTNEFGDVELTRQTSGGNPDGWLQIRFPPTSIPEFFEEEWNEIVHVSPDNLLANFRSGVAFDFLAATRLPQDLQLQFHSESGNIWGYSLTSAVTQTQTWTRISVPLIYSDAWGGLPGFDDTLDQFVSDLASMDWIGIYIWRDEASEEIYGIDNFRFMVPEPGEVIMLALAGFVAIQVLRKRSDATACEASPA